MKCPLVYPNNNRPEEAREIKLMFLVLGELKYEEDEEPEKVWEIIEGDSSRLDLFEYLKANYQWLDLDNTKIYASGNTIETENMIDFEKEPQTAYETIKLLQSIFIDDTFDIDEVIDNNIY